MANVRYFSGSRDLNKRSAASEMMRFEMQKGGKLSPGDRYKRIVKQKIADSQNRAIGGHKAHTFALPGVQTQQRTMSKGAEEAFRKIAARKAIKETKKERKMVIVKPKNFSNGRINKKGQIMDVQGNVIGKVNLKGGDMVSNQGGKFGVYNPKSMMTDMAIQNAINAYSPHFINLRKNGGAVGAVYGLTGDSGYGGGGSGMAMHGAGALYGNHEHETVGWSGHNFEGPRQNVGVTAWGAMADNTYGVYTDNVWGTSMDNAWGTNMTDVWGGVGGTSFGKAGGGSYGTGGRHAFGGQSHHMWGSGSGVNHLVALIAHIAAFFGIGIKTKNSAAMQEHLANLRASRGAGGHDAHATVRTSGSEHVAVVRVTRGGGAH